MYYVYWLKLPGFNLDQGYIGISHNCKERLSGHKRKTNAHLKNAFAKYGEQIKQVILLAGTKEYCLLMEEKLRPTEDIGWNIVKGGGMPPRKKKGQGKGAKMPDGFNQGAKHPMYGRHHTAESKAKASATWERRRNDRIRQNAAQHKLPESIKLSVPDQAGAQS